MKFATLPNGTPDGALFVVSRDLTRATRAKGVANLQALMGDWTPHAANLEAQHTALNDGAGDSFDPTKALARLPRALEKEAALFAQLDA